METVESGLRDDNDLENNGNPTVSTRGGPARLPPLDNRGGGDMGPPLRDYTIAETKSKSAIISLPDNDESTQHIAVAKDEDNESSRISNRPPPRGKDLEMVVYFQNKEGIHLTLEDGHKMEAAEIFEIVIEEMKLPVTEAREAFSLWLVSDLLELQLKPNHIPFKLVCYWEELLEKYTTANEEDIQRDEPVVMFQRNVFYPLWKELEIEDPELLKFLYHEAKENVVDGRYPLTKEQYDKLAGLQALLVHGTYSEDIHNVKYYKSRIHDYYPSHMQKGKYSFPGKRSKESPEYRLAEQHRRAFTEFRVVEHPVQAKKVHKSYLKFCRSLPYYGAAFFRGQVEHPGKKLLQTRIDDPVWVAINTNGIYIIDMDDYVFLFGLTFKQAQVEYAQPKDKDNPDCLPCLFLQFSAKDNGRKVTKILQVFSRESVLMDALADACVRLEQEEHEARQLAESRLPRNEEMQFLKGSDEVWAEFNRLCLATFDEKGELLSNTARIPKSKK